MPPSGHRSLLRALQAHGVRITAQRRTLLEIIEQAGQRLDAAAILERARKCDARIDRATVYRTIELLKKERLIDEPGVHLTCFECGRIEEVASPLFERLKTEIAMCGAFEVQIARLELGGVCASCCARRAVSSKENG